jgi:hypothetical protein
VAWMLYMYGLGFGHYRYFLNANCESPNSLWGKTVYSQAGTRTAYAINSFSRFPCSAFFTHRAWLMYRKNWAIPVVIAPIVAASAGCSVAVAVTYKYLPLRTVPRICIWLMVSHIAIGVVHIVQDVKADMGDRCYSRSSPTSSSVRSSL